MRKVAVILALLISAISITLINFYNLNKDEIVENIELEHNGVILDYKDKKYIDRAVISIEGNVDRSHNIHSFLGTFKFKNTTFDFESIGYNGGIEIFFSDKKNIHKHSAITLKDQFIDFYSDTYFDKILIPINDAKGNTTSKFFIAPCSNREEAVKLANYLLKGTLEERVYTFE